jgi:hypothetical protein
MDLVPGGVVHSMPSPWLVVYVLPGGNVAVAVPGVGHHTT